MLVLATGPPHHHRQRTRRIRGQKRADRKFGRAEARQVGERVHRPVEIIESVARDIFGDRHRLKPMGEPRRHRADDIERRRVIAGQRGMERVGDMAHAFHDRQRIEPVRRCGQKGGAIEMS